MTTAANYHTAQRFTAMGNFKTSDRDHRLADLNCLSIDLLANSAQVIPVTAYYTTTLHPFNGLFSRTTWVSWHQTGRPFWILVQQEMMGWQCYQLDHTQIICTSLQTHNHASTSPLSFYRPDALPAAKPTASMHRRQFQSLHSRAEISSP